jgi:hypothetical protein
MLRVACLGLKELGLKVWIEGRRVNVVLQTQGSGAGQTENGEL